MKLAWTAAALGLLLGAAALGADDEPDSARDQAVAWIKANNKFGPNSQLVRDMTDQIDSQIDKVNNLSLTFGGGLTKSDKACQLNIWAGQFFVFELTDDQAKQLGVGDKSVDFTTGTKHLDKRKTPALVKLQNPKLDGGANVDGGKPVAGKVKFKVTTKPTEQLALRLSYAVGESTSSSFTYLDAGLPDDDAISFSFSPINKDSNKAYAGPLVLFVDLVTVKNVDSDVQVTILSNTTAVLVDVGSGDK